MTQTAVVYTDLLTPRDISLASRVYHGFRDAAIAADVLMPIEWIRPALLGIRKKLYPSTCVGRVRPQIFRWWAQFVEVPRLGGMPNVHANRGAFVYFIRTEQSERVKIGTSTDPFLRLEMLQSTSPDRLRLLGYFPGGTQTEARLHDRFRHCRVHGEWFERDEQLSEFFARRFGSSDPSALEVY